MTGSSTLMLPLLLLPLVISFCQSSEPCRRMREFKIDLISLNETVKDCWTDTNCSSVHITDKCKCFNLTAYIGKFPDYFITGLESLNHNIHSQKYIKTLTQKLNFTGRHCQNKINLTSLTVKYEPVISPADLVQKLEDLIQQIKSLLSR